MIHCDFMKSEILTHPDSECCASAVTWFLARDRADQILVSKGFPSNWLQQTCEWGPCIWPFYWCDLLEKSRIDCGVFADLYQTMLTRRGYNVARLQVIEQVHPAQVKHWSSMWDNDQCDSTRWIVDDDSVYHEILVVRDRGDIRFFDPTDHIEVGRDSSLSGRPRMLRLSEPIVDCEGMDLHWGHQQLVVGEWVDVGVQTVVDVDALGC